MRFLRVVDGKVGSGVKFERIRRITGQQQDSPKSSVNPNFYPIRSFIKQTLYKGQKSKNA